MLKRLTNWFIGRLPYFDITKTIDCETCGGAGVIFNFTKIGADENCPTCNGKCQIESIYLRRYYIFKSRYFNIFLHHIRRSDDDPDPHDHPWSFLSLILKNGYTDEAYGWTPAEGYPLPPNGMGYRAEPRAGPFSLEEGKPHFRPVFFYRYGILAGPFHEKVKPGRLVFRRAEHIHRVLITNGPAWTLVVGGPERRPWGFVSPNKWIFWREYLNAWGTHHA